MEKLILLFVPDGDKNFQVNFNIEKSQNDFLKCLKSLVPQRNCAFASSKESEGSKERRDGNHLG